MLRVEQAQTIIQQQARVGTPAATPLTPSALGLILAEDVASDLDMPPFDKALMDGFAVRAADLPGGLGTLSIIEEITAGQTPKHPIQAGQASRIMTGAPIPQGADAIVMVERTKGDLGAPATGGTVQIEDAKLRPGSNILERAKEMRRGEVVLRQGAILRPQEFGLLATVGRTAVLALPRPTVAVLSTGDEVVEASQVPGPGQIRNSNGPTLVAQVSRAGGQPRYLGIARDRLDSLRPLIAEGLQSDFLILSGGVSAGKLDLVPGVLQELGVQPHFHKVAMKPGKPVFFGTYPALSTRHSALIFGLPGNPVSALVCFELFIRPAMRKFQGHVDPGPRIVQAILAEDFPYKTDRPTYYPARLAADGQVQPMPWLGSADLRAITQANAFVVFPEGDHQHRAGQSLGVLCVEYC